MAGHSTAIAQSRHAELPIVAHRGNAGEFPENTLPAIRSAIELGCRYVEFDVQIAKDGVPVVIHDSDVKRTGAIAGSVFEMPGARLAQTSVHEPARFGGRFSGTPVPLLSQVVAVLQEAPDVTSFVEIKRASIARHGLDRTMEAILGAAAPIKASAVIISFGQEAVRYAADLGWRTGGVVTTYDDETRREISALRPEFVFCNYLKVQEAGADLWPGAWRWVVYEIASVELARAWLKRGAHLLETMQVRALTEGLSSAAGA
jgi:glycerophosphoryl diester phosphodiesterase